MGVSASASAQRGDCALAGVEIARIGEAHDQGRLAVMLRGHERQRGGTGARIAIVDSSSGAPAAAAMGVEPVHIRPYLGEPLPDAEDLTGLVVLGGPEGAADDEAPEHLVRERDLLRSAVDMGLPVLGICFGAQLLAVALGGAVTRDTEPEVGIDVVRLTHEGRHDAVLGSLLREFPMLQWHYHSYSPPAGAGRLASSDACSEQAFRIGERAYGLKLSATGASPGVGVERAWEWRSLKRLTHASNRLEQG